MFIDGGTTLEHFAMLLAGRIAAGEIVGVALFTNSLTTLNALRDVPNVTLMGGAYRAARQDFSGYLAEAGLRHIRFTKSFLGADAVELARGFTTTDYDTAQMNNLVVQSSDKTYVLADSSKFSKSSLTPFATPEQIHAVITDGNLPEAARAEFTQQGFKFL